jgi:hypothetical protein
MTTQDDDFARKITTCLDRGTAKMKAGTAYRLQLARTEALARLAEPRRAAQPQHAHALAGGGGTVGGGSGVRSATKLGLALLIALAAVFGYQQWQAYQQLKDIEDTDAAILSSDLPIDAFLDRGFPNWLKTSSDD